MAPITASRPRTTLRRIRRRGPTAGTWGWRGGRGESVTASEPMEQGPLRERARAGGRQGPSRSGGAVGHTGKGRVLRNLRLGARSPGKTGGPTDDRKRVPDRPPPVTLPAGGAIRQRQRYRRRQAWREARLGGRIGTAAITASGWESFAARKGRPTSRQPRAATATRSAGS